MSVEEPAAPHIKTGEAATEMGHLMDNRHEADEDAMRTPREMLATYLRRIGLARITDSAQQYQVTLLRQFIEHLDEVLRSERVDDAIRIRIVRTMIYGGTPTLAEAGVREDLVGEMQCVLERGTFSMPLPDPGLPPRG